MEALFQLVPLGVIAVAVYCGFVVVRRHRRISSAWSSGFTAPARCVRSYTTTSGGGNRAVSTTLHHVYEFTTHDGRVVRFDEEGGPSTTVEGDIVTVHYRPERPEHATARGRAPGRLGLSTGCSLLFVAVFIAFGVVFLIVVNSDSSMP